MVGCRRRLYTYPEQAHSHREHLIEVLLFDVSSGIVSARNTFEYGAFPMLVGREPDDWLLVSGNVGYGWVDDVVVQNRLYVVVGCVMPNQLIEWLGCWNI